jgi:hypothetical protein
MTELQQNYENERKESALHRLYAAGMSGLYKTGLWIETTLFRYPTKPPENDEYLRKSYESDKRVLAGMFIGGVAVLGALTAIEFAPNIFE